MNWEKYQIKKNSFTMNRYQSSCPTIQAQKLNSSILVLQKLQITNYSIIYFTRIFLKWLSNSSEAFSIGILKVFSAVDITIENL